MAKFGNGACIHVNVSYLDDFMGGERDAKIFTTLTENFKLQNAPILEFKVLVSRV